MSQLQVTGEAKIRDIQGPVVANDGVITALDGAASQYVRGDGTLADFPTSTGGGSSVSYYLNGSVNQGNIGGTVYYQMSKSPVIGTGTDFSISNNDLLAAFITDANDPALLEVPGGNFNCEFYFSVNSNSGNPYVYAELYKVNGSTFTLLGSSVSVPEYLNNGTTISPYYFAIPVSNAALTATDRIAIRIFANVDSRTVTLHTENSHLCQVVTTFSKGLTALNNLTKQIQYFGVGTSGTDFNIVSSGDTHTFNIPSADGSNRGLVTTGTQTFGGNKSFGGTLTAANLNVSGVLTVLGNLSNGTYNYTLPSANGQLALSSQIPTISGSSYQVARFNVAGTALENSSIFDNGSATGSPTGQVTINSRLGVNNFTELNKYLAIIQNPNESWVPPASGVNLELFFNSVSGISGYRPDSAYIRPRNASDETFKTLIIQGDSLILNDTTSRKTLINKQAATQTTTKLEVAGYARFDNNINVIGALYLNATDVSQPTYIQAPSGNLSMVTSGTILLRSGSNTGIYVDTTGYVGINGATPTVPLTVSGAGLISGDLTVNGLINNTYSNNAYLGLNIRNTNTGDSALSGLSIQNAAGTTVGQINYVSTVYANPTLRNTLLINTVYNNKLAFATNSGGGETRADIYFTVNPAFTLDVYNPNQIQILGTSRNVIINYSGTDFGANFQVNGTTRLSAALSGTSATFSGNVSASNGTLIGGTGTTNTLPKFTGTSAIGNSNITDTGSLITLGSNTTISSGGLGIGTTSLTGYELRVGANITGATTSYGIAVDGTIQSDVTSTALIYTSRPATAAASFNLGTLGHYYVTPGTVGAGSTIGTQVGFWVSSGLTTATTNYAFYSLLAAGTGRWNIYMEGTANNYMAGSLGIGTTSLGGINLAVRKNITGGYLTTSTSGAGIVSNGAIQSDVTLLAFGYATQLSTQAAAFTLGGLQHYTARNVSIGSTSAITIQTGFNADNLTGATVNYGFRGNIAATTNAWNLYMEGTANNYMAGSLGIGTTSPSGKLSLYDTSDLWINISRGSSFVNIGVDSTGTFYNTNSNHRWLYNSGNNEAMRITSGGQLLIGTTSSSGVDKVRVNNDGTTSYSTVNITNANSTANFYLGVGGSSVANSNLRNNAYVWNAAASDLLLGTSDTERMRITSGGDVYINKTADTPATLGAGSLQVNNEIMSNGSLSGIFWENRNGGVTSSSNWGGFYWVGSLTYLFNGSGNAAAINMDTGVYTPLSDKNKKKDFEHSTIGLNAILGLKPTLYRMKTESEDAEKQLGFIAQEVKEFIPQAYVESDEFIGLNDRPIIAALVKAVQEQQAQIEELKALINK